MKTMTRRALKKPRARKSSAEEHAEAYAEKVGAHLIETTRLNIAEQQRAQAAATAENRANVRLNMAAGFMQCRIRENPDMNAAERARAVVADVDALLEALDNRGLQA